MMVFILPKEIIKQIDKIKEHSYGREETNSTNEWICGPNQMARDHNAKRAWWIRDQHFIEEKGA
jgi:hypothetical protein